MFFVDELEKKVYGNKLSYLDKNINYNRQKYPLITKTNRGEKILFPLCLMEEYFDLTEKQVLKIKNSSTRNNKYKYIKAKKFNVKWIKNINWS